MKVETTRSLTNEKKHNGFQVLVGLLGLATIAWSAHYLFTHWGDTKVDIHAYKCDSVTLANCEELDDKLTVSVKDGLGDILQTGETSSVFWVEGRNKEPFSVSVMSGLEQIIYVQGQLDRDCSEYEEKVDYETVSGEIDTSTIIRRNCQGGDSNVYPDKTLNLRGITVEQPESKYPWGTLKADIIYTEQ